MENFLQPAIQAGRVTLLASATARTVQTATILTDNALAVNAPDELDIAFLGPNNEDLETARVLAGEASISVKDAFLQLEDYGRPRLGEKPAITAERLRHGLLQHTKPGKILLYCGNSPGCNMALGVDGVMSDLELIAAVVSDGAIRVVARIAPAFAKEEAAA